MEEKLLGSIVVSHYGPFEKGEAKAFAADCMRTDSVLEVVHGTSAAGAEVCTVFSRNGENPYMGSLHLAVIMLSTIPDDQEVE